MLPPKVSQSLAHLTSAVIGFGVITITGALVAMLLTRTLGGASASKRQVIFSIVTFASICLAGYYTMSRLGGG